MSHTQLFEKMAGKWEGTCKTWFKPGELADESKVLGEIKVVMKNFLRHSYTGSMKGKPRHGEELTAYNSITKEFQVNWIDDFHMSNSMLFSLGEVKARGFSVQAKYDVGEDLPPWGWRTEYELIDDDHLTITAYNITPDGQEGKAVETVYVRVK